MVFFYQVLKDLKNHPEEAPALVFSQLWFCLNENQIRLSFKI